MKKARLVFLMFAVLSLAGMTAMAQAPTISGLSLSASSPSELTNDDLESSYTMTGGTVETAEAWYRNGSPITELYLPFEGGGTNALLDFSGNGHNASLDGDPGRHPAWSAVDGYNLHGVFTFDGNDYLNAGDVLPLNASYTKTAWIYKTGLAVTFRNIMSSNFYGPNNHFLKVDNDGRLNAGHRNGSATVISADSLFNDQWYFVAVTFNYSTGEMTLYLDGEVIDVGTVPSEYRSVADAGVLIGSMAYTSEWVGRIDEPRIFNRELTREQIKSIFDNGNGIITASETRGSESWRVEVTPFSGSAVGSTYVSNTITLGAGPAISGLTLDASSPGDLTIDDLDASFTENASVVESAVAWYKNGEPDAIMYLPFEGGHDNLLLDFSGNDNHARYTSGANSRPEWLPDGGHNGAGAFHFDGYNDYLIAGDILPLNADYTKSAWIYPTGSLTDFRNIMSSDFYGPNNHYLKLTDSGYLTAGQNTGQTQVIDAVPLSTITWYHVAVTFDYSTGEMILYKNGAEVDRATLPEADRSVADPTVLIGSMAFTVEFLGRIDEPSLYGRVLSPEQIQEMYANGRATMVAEETRGSDEYHVEVTPFSVSEIGSTVTSNTIEVNSTIVTSIPDETVAEGTAFSTIDLDDYVSDYEYADNQLTWATHGETDLIINISTGRVATISVPNADWYGSEDVYFVATNPYGDADSTEVTFTVTNVNDAPVLTDILDQSTNEDVTLTGLPVVFSDPDAVDSHTITVVSSNPNVTMASLSGNTSGSTYSLVPATNWNGTADITVTVTDNGTGALADFEVYTLTVNPVNDPPVLTEVGDQSTNEDVPLNLIEVEFTDVDAGDLHTINVVSDEANVSVENLTGDISGSTYNLVPAANWFGTAQITVYVIDNGTGTLEDTETYTLTVNPVNDPPVLTEIGAQSTDEDVDLSGLSVVFTDVDAGDTHTITVSPADANVTVAGLSGNTSGSTYTLSPAANWNGTIDITVTVTDNGTGALSDSETYTLTVNAINDAPVITEVGDLSVDEDNVLSGVAVVFTDPESADTHEITVVSDEANVTVANLSGDVSGSTYSLIPAADWNGTAQITVTVTQVGSPTLEDTEIYTLTVNPVNDGPEELSLSATSVDERVVAGTVVGIFSTVDVDEGDTHTYSFTTDGGVFDVDNAAFLIDGDSLKTNSEVDFETQSSYSILVMTTDGGGGTEIQNFTISVNDIDETSVEDIYNSPSFNVYPVPAVDYVTVEVDNPENRELLLEIYYATGAVVHSEPIFDKKRVDLSGFKDGMYIVRIKGERVYGTRKLIVKDR